MAVHFTIYPDDRTAAMLRRFMATHDCTATRAVQLLIAHEPATAHLAADAVPAPFGIGQPTRLAVA